MEDFIESLLKKIEGMYMGYDTGDGYSDGYDRALIELGKYLREERKNLTNKT